MGRRRSKASQKLEPNLYQYQKGSITYYHYKHPQTGKFHSFGTDRNRARSAARQLNARLMPGEDLVAMALGHEKRTFCKLIKLFQKERVESSDLREGSKENKINRLNRIDQDLGEKLVDKFETYHCANYLSGNFEKDSYRQHRSVLNQLCTFAKEKGWIKDNPVTDTAPSKEATKGKRRSKKVRQRLTPEVYQAIRSIAPDWFQVALDLALLCGQGRAEVSAMKYEHIVDGRLRVIREKTYEQTETAYIAVQITATIDEVIKRSRQIQPLSPFIVHRMPEKKIKSKYREHWSQLLPDYLTRTFAKLRDKTGLVSHMSPDERPTFHEIRSLSGRLLEKQGWKEEKIQMLYGHADPEMTRHYLADGIKWVEAEGANLDPANIISI